MKRFITPLIVLAAMLSALGTRAAGYPHFPIRDLALIYAGESFRPKWTPDQMAQYVGHTFADGSSSWLFDGFLFIEFRTPADRYFIPYPNKEMARKTDWQEYMDNLFTTGVNIDALDKAVSIWKKTLGAPDYRHKVVLSVFVPDNSQTDWGSIDGRALNFTKTDDQVAACRWMIDQLVSRFNAAGYANLDLAGIYWCNEQLNNRDAALQVSKIVKSYGFNFVWIPWFKSPGFDDPGALGFDMTYLQPNYFFNTKVEKSRLTEACRYARQYSLGLEFEADERCMSTGGSPDHVTRFDDYLTAFKKQKALTQAPLAYYLSSNLLCNMLNSKNADDNARAESLCRMIADRRKISRLNP
jgi:hypothetical protein